MPGGVTVENTGDVAAQIAYAEPTPPTRRRRPSPGQGDAIVVGDRATIMSAPAFGWSGT